MDKDINYYGTGIKTLRGASTGIFVIGIIAFIIIIIAGLNTRDPLPYFAVASICLVFGIFLYAVGKVLATIAEAYLKKNQ